MMISPCARLLPAIPCLLIFLRASLVAEAQRMPSVLTTPVHTVEPSGYQSTRRQLSWSPIVQLNQLVKPRRDRLPPGFNVLRVTPLADGRQKLVAATAEGTQAHILIAKLLESVPRFHLNTPYFYPDSSTVVFPGGHQHPHNSPIIPLVIRPAPFAGSFVPYPGYPEAVYQPNGGVRPEQNGNTSDQGSSNEHQHHDERIVYQEHVKRVKVVPASQKSPTYITTTNGIPVALKIFPHPQWIPISKEHHQNQQTFHYSLL